LHDEPSDTTLTDGAPAVPRGGVVVPAGSPAARAAPESIAPSVSASTAASVLSPAAIEQEREQRSRAALRMMVIVGTLCVAILQIVERRTPAHWVLTAAILATIAVAVWGMYATRGGRPIAQTKMALVGACGILCVLAGIAYVGVLSPTVVILCMIIYFWGSGELPWVMRPMFVLVAGGYLVLAVLAYVEVLPLTGSTMPLATENKRGLVAFTVLLEAIFAFTLWLAHQGRKATLGAFQALESARRQVQQREALLLEARADLERARDAGRLGRFTGHNVGSFVAGEVIGRGATGEVYEARSSTGGEPAALKVLHPYLFTAGSELERFLREADVASRLDSPHVVRVLESGRTEDGSPYFAMELLRGADLATLLRDQRRLGIAEVLTVATHVGDALRAAQEAGIVHRDIKPQNLFQSDDAVRGRTWKVLDFGVSKIGEEAGTLTRGAAVGTPGYMAPEQARGQAVDHRADVFALGAVVYRALTGRPAFSAADSVATLYQVAYVQPPRPSALVPLHADVDLVLALALAKNARQRFHSAATFAAALRDATRGDLDEPFRDAALTLLAVQPWGSDSGERS
jgi:serine/threonine-protein kinase